VRPDILEGGRALIEVLSSSARRFSAANDYDSPLAVGSRWSRILDLSRDWRDWLFVPLGAQFAFVVLVLYPPYAQFVVQVGALQRHVNPVFPYTWASALGLFAYGIWLFHWRYRVDWTRAIVYSLGLCFAATSLFEIVWQNVGAGQGVGNQFLEGQVINLSSIAFGLSSLRFWRFNVPVLAASNLYWMGWLLWLADGYPQTYNLNPSLAAQAYAFNAALKIASYVLFALVVSFATRLRPSR